MLGTISNVIVAKKYGFISGDNGQEYFFHKEDLQMSWDDFVETFDQLGGAKIKVSFTAEKTLKGPRARAVTIVEG